MISSVILPSSFHADCINFFDDIGTGRCIGAIIHESGAKP